MTAARIGSTLVATVLLASSLTGCGWLNDDKGIFVNRDDDYIDMEERAALVVPTDLQASKVADPYPIPRTPRQLNPEFYPFKPPRPDAIFASDNRDEVRIQRLGERAWLVVPEDPTTVWPKVKQFLAENGIRVESEMTEYGRLDTQWLDTSQDAYRDIIRTVHPGGEGAGWFPRGPRPPADQGGAGHSRGDLGSLRTPRERCPRPAERRRGGPEQHPFRDSGGRDRRAVRDRRLHRRQGFRSRPSPWWPPTTPVG